MHAAGPDLAVLVDGGAIGPSVGWQRILRELLRLGVEGRDLVAAVFRDHDAIRVPDRGQAVSNDQ